MDIVMLIIIAAAVAAFVVIRVGLKRLASRAVGRQTPDTAAIDGDLAPGTRRVYVFHAPHCGPCRAMMPTVDRIRETHPNLIKVDVSRDSDLARAFGVVAIGRRGDWAHVASHSDAGIPLLDGPHCGPTLVRERDDGEGHAL